jgi:hypothetical protein
MGFSISLFNEIVTDSEISEKNQYGLIQIGDFQERFLASLSYWKPDDYKIHWKNGIRRIIEGADVSCLITSMYDPTTANYIFWWPMYRQGDIIIFQNQILFLNTIRSHFDENNPYEFVGKRRTVNEEGNDLSEWATPIQEITDFFHRKLNLTPISTDGN